MIVDAEKLVSGYLRAHADVIALRARVVGKTPASTEAPWVRVTQLDARNETNSKTERLINYLLQLDCYAGADGGQPEANTLGLAVREALHSLPGTALGDAEASKVTFAGHARIPDSDIDEPARERVVLTAGVVIRGG